MLFIKLIFNIRVLYIFYVINFNNMDKKNVKYKFIYMKIFVYFIIFFFAFKSRIFSQSTCVDAYLKQPHLLDQDVYVEKYGKDYQGKIEYLFFFDDSMNYIDFLVLKDKLVIQNNNPHLHNFISELVSFCNNEGDNGVIRYSQKVAIRWKKRQIDGSYLGLTERIRGRSISISQIRKRRGILGNNY
jgi:hypothetical protein